MIVYENKGIETRSDVPNEDFSIDKIAKYIVEDGTELAEKILLTAPYFEPVLDDKGKLIDITPTERPIVPEPEKQPTTEEYLLDYEFRISMLELGGTV